MDWMMGRRTYSPLQLVRVHFVLLAVQVARGAALRLYASQYLAAAPPRKPTCCTDELALLLPFWRAYPLIYVAFCCRPITSDELTPCPLTSI